MSILDKNLIVTMPDGKWAVPVHAIAENRASFYAREYDWDIEVSLAQDTKPLFEESDFEVCDWARNQMRWREVKEVAQKVNDFQVDYEDGWTHGDMKIE